MKQVWKNIRLNFGTFLAFQMLFGLCGLAITAFFYNVVFRFAVDVTVGYIAAHTIAAFIKHPISWLCVALFVVVFAIFSFSGIVAAIYLNECGRQRIHVHVKDVLKVSVIAAARTVRPRNWKMVVLVILVLPLLNLGIIPVAGTIVIPDFIMEYIGYYWYLSVLYAAVMVILVVLAVRWRYVFHFMVVERLPFRQAAACSARLGKKQTIRDVVMLVLCEAGIYLFIGAVVVVAGLLALPLAYLSVQSSGFLKGLFGVLSSATVVAGISVAGMALLLNVPVCYSFLSNRFYQLKDNSGSPAPLMDVGIKESRPKSKTALIGVTAAFALAVVGISFVVVNLHDGSVQELLDGDDELAVELARKTDVVAHRCGAHYAPENTVAALNKAADMGVTWCEIDCQQLADGTIIVMHDTNFKRTTGFDKNSWEATWEEVEPLDAGSFFSPAYAGEKIPLLDDIIKAAKARNIKLQIEIKPTGNEINLEQGVIDVVKANGFQNDCRIASQDYDCLQKVRNADCSVRTLYITSCAFGDIMKADAADDFSIEATWITDELVEYLHEGNRVVFAWTVNSSEIMERVVDCGIDGLVTDEVETGVQVCNDADLGILATSFFDMLGI